MDQLDHKSTKDYVSMLLKQEILKGTIKDGTELTQEDIASRLGISRIPVREAFQNLTDEGFLKKKNNRHIEVIGVQPGTIRYIMGMIASLETEICLLLTERQLPAVHMEQLENIGALYKQKAYAQCADQMLGFHLSLSQALNIAYIELYHTKLLSGYPAYIWKNINLDWHKQLVMLKELLGHITSHNSAAIETVCRKYFNDLALAFIEERKTE